MKRKGVPQLMVGDLGFHVVRLGPAVDEAGDDRPPVVFLHGLIIDNISTFYYTLAPVAARRHHVVCYDMRGHGAHRRTAEHARLHLAVKFGVVPQLQLAHHRGVPLAEKGMEIFEQENRRVHLLDHLIQRRQRIACR